MNGDVLKGQSITALSSGLEAGRFSSRDLVEAALNNVSLDSTAFMQVAAERARAEADARDKLRRQGPRPSPLEGIPVSVKDLFDVRGEVTAAGSVVLRDTPAALADAPVVARLRAAGAIIIGRTHMSEFAFTGLGANPHFRACANPHDASRVPGGSSSGAAVSVARGQAAMGLGTDTGGSVRIPASYCGLAGFKPTQFRVTRDGAFALSETLDSIGPIANTVACCAIVDRIIADVSVPAHPPLALKDMRLGVPQDFVLEGLDVQVAKAFERSLSRLALAGARIEKVATPHFLEIPSLFAAGTIANAEAFALHTRLGLLERGDLYDPMVRVRIEMAARMSARDLIELHRARTRLVVETARLTSGLDALVLPATANVAPKYADIADAAAFAKVNGLALRNTSLFNFLDRCALSIPMQAEGELPCGLMVVGEHGGDMRLLALGESIEAVLRA